MSYGFMGYMADLGALQAAAGSGDEGLLQALVARFAPAPETEAALGQLLRGEPKDPALASSYGYAFELLVRHVGQTLPNRALSGCSPGYLEVVDAALQAGGVTAISLEGLCYGALPVPLPTPSNFPGYGYLSPAQVIEAEGHLLALPDPDEPYLLAVVQELRGWTREARAQGWGVLAFYY